MRNIGPKTMVWLERIDIRNREDLKKLGAVEVYLRLIETGHAENLNLLWALEGAVQDEAWQIVARLERLRLLNELDAARVQRRQ